MLIEFSVRNFRSFMERATLSMEATSLTSRDRELDENAIFDVLGLRLLTSTAIYGANASGKSNLVRAMDFMRNFILNSSKFTQAGEPIPTEPFALDLKTPNEPSEFEIIFIAEGRQYRYGFEVSTTRVEREWLYYVPAKTEKPLFERTGQNIRIMSKVFSEGKGIADMTRENALFLSVVAQFNGEIAKLVLHWAIKMRVITGIDEFETDSLKMASIISVLNDNSKDVVGLLRGFDTDIHDISIIESESEYNKLQIMSKHPVFTEDGNIVGYREFDLDKHESEGTKKLFSLAALIIQALRDGSVLVIDEFDARLHPKITKGIVQLFNSKTNNPHHAQLVFLTHDTNLLNKDLLRRDQIWFVEKDQRCNSHLYSLAELKVRNDASFENDYVTGKYGAIPFVGNLSAIVEDILEKEKADAEIKE